MLLFLHDCSSEACPAGNVGSFDLDRMLNMPTWNSQEAAAAWQGGAQAPAYGRAIGCSAPASEQFGGSRPLSAKRGRWKRMPEQFSGAEEYEPDHGQDQYRQSEGHGEEGQDGRPGLTLTSFGRGFDDPTVLSRCHGALDQQVRRAR
jgi:hypothetical protein